MNNIFFSPYELKYLMKQRLVYSFYIFYACLCLCLAAFEVYKYPGIVFKFTHIDLIFYIYLLIFMTTGVEKPVKFKAIITTIAALIFIFCLGISFTEIFTYKNYVFSQFHINTNGIGNLVIIPLIILYPYYGPNVMRVKKMAILILGCWSIINIFDTINYAGSKIVTQIRYPNASYDEKMSSSLGDFYRCMMIIKNNTPNNSTIYIPPQADVWEMEGNEYLVRYFLYPREIKHFEKVSDTSISTNPYIIYSWGYWQGKRSMGAWPYETIYALSGKFVNTENDFGSKIPSIFDRNKMKNPNTCGIIKPIFK